MGYNDYGDEDRYTEFKEEQFSFEQEQNMLSKSTNVQEKATKAVIPDETEKKQIQSSKPSILGVKPGKRIIPLLAFILLLAGCSTERKAQREKDKLTVLAFKHPAKLAELCDAKFPLPEPIIKDSIVYGKPLPPEILYVDDSVLLDYLQTLVDTKDDSIRNLIKRLKIPCPPCNHTAPDTVYRTATVYDTRA